MSDLLSVVAKVSALLAGLDPDERMKALSLVLQASESTADYRKRIARDRRRRQRDKYGTDAGQQPDDSATNDGQPKDNNRTSVLGGGIKRGSLLHVSDLGSPLQSSTLSSLGSPTPATGSTVEISAETTAGSQAWGSASDEGRPGFTRTSSGVPAPSHVVTGAVHPPPDNLASDGGTPGSVIGERRADDPRATRDNAEPQRDRWPAVTAGRDPHLLEPPRRFNPAALVEHFVAGVNEAGGVWTCGNGKPFTDLAAALQPHAHPSPYDSSPLAWVRLLGRRWFAYCGGAPRDAWKAAAWLGEGAPERQAKPGETTPLTKAQEGAAKARRLREALAREEAYRERERNRAPPPPEVAELFKPKAMP